MFYDIADTGLITIYHLRLSVLHGSLFNEATVCKCTTYLVVLNSKYVSVCSMAQLFILVIPHALNSTVDASAQEALCSS